MSDARRDPRVRSQTTYWIDCTVCGSHADRPPPPRYASEAEMWHAMLDPGGSGWTRRDDGRVLCPTHADAAQCDENGHTMTPWTAHPLDERLKWRYCARCGADFAQQIEA